MQREDYSEWRFNNVRATMAAASANRPHSVIAEPGSYIASLRFKATTYLPIDGKRTRAVPVPA